MKYPYYDMSVPVVRKTLVNLKAFLKKGEAFAKEKSIHEEVMLGLRLAPNMFSLVRQVQIATDNAKGITARLAEMEPPKMEDNEKTFEELYQRIDRTIAFLDTLTPEQFANSAEAKVRLVYFPGKHYLGKEYLPMYGLPNFFFHVVTAYDILRSNGVVIGKGDYLDSMPSHDD